MNPEPHIIEVVKIGGADGVPLEPLCADLARAHAAGRRIVLVHGGSGETDRLAAALGVAQEQIVSPSGQVSRRTDRATLEVFVQATALVNRKLVELLGADRADRLRRFHQIGGTVRRRHDDFFDQTRVVCRACKRRPCNQTRHN